MVSIEHQIIGCLFDDPLLAKNIQITSDHFEDVDEQEVFSNLMEIISEGVEPDPVLLAERIEARTGRNMLPAIIGLVGGPRTTKNAIAYQEAIIKRYRQRQQVRIAGDFYRSIKACDEGAFSHLLESMKTIERPLVSYRSIGDLIPSVLTEIDEIHYGDGAKGVKTGITKLDQKTGGLQPTDLIIIAARTSVGKTAFMMNIAANLGDVPGGVISGEQASNQIVQRVLAKQGRVSAQDMRTGGLDQRGMDVLVAEASKLKGRPLYIADIPRPSIDMVEATARQMHFERDIQILFVDYLQLLKNPAYQDRRLQVDDISKRLKGLALELKIPVVCLAQLNREAVDRSPRISDLKESGAIEEDADQIILLSRNDEENQLWIDVQKNRNGEVGSFPCGWDARSMRVINL